MYGRNPRMLFEMARPMRRVARKFLGSIGGTGGANATRPT